MSVTRVLVVVEPRTYREVLVLALQKHRPDAEVSTGTRRSQTMEVGIQGLLRMLDKAEELFPGLDTGDGCST